tara:strand:+ start:852 stop:1427 length:576 start_codon:yes stop_codon:yes gene_type:complete
MPVGLQVNDYDSEEDVSSTEDDNLNLPVVNKKNKKLKSKKKNEKKSILKESKIVKDKAREKIKNMENEVKDINSVNYLENNKEKSVTFGNDEIREFYTDEELAEQFAELKKLEARQKILWKHAANSHVGVSEKQERAAVIRSIVPLLGSGNILNSSRTKKLNTTSRVNTSLPRGRPKRIAKRNYYNMGKMW